MMVLPARTGARITEFLKKLVVSFLKIKVCDSIPLWTSILVFNIFGQNEVLE